MNTSELKPCPFCGSDPVLQVDIRYPRPEREPRKAFEVVCQNYDCIIGHVDERYKLSAKEAIEWWNRRADHEYT